MVLHRHPRLRKLFLLTTATSVGATAALLVNSAFVDESKKRPFSNGLGLGATYSLFGPILRRLPPSLIDPEDGHRAGVAVSSLSRKWRARLGLIDDTPDPLSLHTCVFNLSFTNPIGIAAGFDKHADAMQGLLDMGFGFVEIGSVTPLPQPGNDKPRVFRLNDERAIINRYGFNSEGISAVAEKLRAYNQQLRAEAADVEGQKQKHWFLGTYSQYGKRGPVGLNLGKNKTSEDAASDYVKGVQVAAEFSDYIVVNVSSPNTPGLRTLQARAALQNLLTAVKKARDDVDARVMKGSADAAAITHKRPLLVKIAPDLSEADKQDIAEVVLRVGIDGLIISNTTLARPPTLVSESRNETGGLSGQPLFQSSTALVADMYRRTRGKVPIIGVGGISSADDAYKKIRAGASLVQLYTAFAFDGPVLVKEMKNGLAEKLQKDGFKSVGQAVGVDAHLYPK